MAGKKNEKPAKGKGKDKDDNKSSDASASKLKAANSINARHILVSLPFLVP